MALTSNFARVYAASVSPVNITIPGGSASGTFRYTFPLGTAPGKTTATVIPMSVTITGNPAGLVTLTFRAGNGEVILGHGVGNPILYSGSIRGMAYEFLTREDANSYLFRIIIDGEILLPEPDSSLNTQAFYVFRFIHPNANNGVTLLPVIKPPLEFGQLGNFTSKEYGTDGGCVLF